MKIYSENLNKFLKTQTLYFHDSHVISFEYLNNQLKLNLEKSNNTIAKISFNKVSKIEYRVGETVEIDLKNRILDIDVKAVGTELLINILLFNMSFIDIYCSSINIE